MTDTFNKLGLLGLSLKEKRFSRVKLYYDTKEQRPVMHCDVCSNLVTPSSSNKLSRGLQWWLRKEAFS